MQRRLLVVVSLSAYLAVSGPGADFSGRGQKNTVGSQDASLTDQELNTLNDLAPKILYLDKLSEAAAQKASDPKTKDLANKVVQDYNNIRSQFRKVATNHSFSYRDAIDLKQKKDVDDMMNLPPDQFDQKYREAVADVSGEIANLLRNDRDKMHSEDIQKFMDGILPLVQAHEQQARSGAGKA